MAFSVSERVSIFLLKTKCTSSWCTCRCRRKRYLVSVVPCIIHQLVWDGRIVHHEKSTFYDFYPSGRVIDIITRDFNFWKSSWMRQYERSPFIYFNIHKICKSTRLSNSVLGTYVCAQTVNGDMSWVKELHWWHRVGAASKILNRGCLSYFVQRYGPNVPNNDSLPSYQNKKNKTAFQ